MLTPRLTNCAQCDDICSLIESIDCKVAEMSVSLYNNVVFMLNKSFNHELLSDLLNYKRILQYKICNPNYAGHFTVNMIASKVRRFTSGCIKDCSCRTSGTGITTTSTSTIAPITTTTSTSSSSTSTTTSSTSSSTTTTTSSSTSSTTSTTSTTTSTSTSTTSTTTTINPLAGDFTVQVGSALVNKINNVTPSFYTITSGSFPAAISFPVTGKVISSGSSITINYDCTGGTPQILIIKNSIVVGNDVGIPQGTNLNYTYTVSWVDTDDIIIALNYS
jgi:hypothetical protein